MMKSLVSVIAKLRRNENGAILVITAAALMVMLGMTAMVVDIGALALEKTRLQSACDAAALAAIGNCQMHFLPGKWLETI